MSIYDTLNEQQKKAVFQTEGPVLILAGAGSGKTRVLTHRAAYLMQEAGVSPYHIMMITFTNKAAGEMRERIDRLVGYGSESIWVSTFHSACVRILRRYIDHLGFDTNFTIYDTEDQKTLMKEICKRLEIDTKIYKEKAFLAAISKAKDKLISPEEFTMQAMKASDYQKRKQAEVYRAYQEALRKNNALDFDDLIVKTVELFQTDAEVLQAYQERFRYIMVDEYQDTNTAQFELIRLLAGKFKNLCVVGDDDQSIYKFRGANIFNILNFEHYFPEAVTIKLEENYRSTQNILNTANTVIANNKSRKQKALWTKKESGELIHFEQLASGYEEAEFVAGEIKRAVLTKKCCYKDCAVLYRTNAQSRLFEESFIAQNIPYKIVGGVNFYARKEIKDLLCYLKTINNGRDEVAVRRIINVPKRGIGAATLAKVTDYAMLEDISFYTALKKAEDIVSIGKSAAKIRPFVTLIERMKSIAPIVGVAELLRRIIEETGYVSELEAEGTDEAIARIQNIDELVSKAVSYEESTDAASLSGFLEEVALVADIDSLDEESDYVVLMTLHSAKGLEFSKVFLTGMEEGLFPSYMSIMADNPLEEIEEERRLAYVGITRAKDELTVSCARGRMIRGEMQYNRVSRFVKEMPEELLKQGRLKRSKYPEKREEVPAKEKNPYRSAMEAGHKPSGQSTQAMAFAVLGGSQKSIPDYQVGDGVSHVKFGNGVVEKIADGGRDYEVTVTFEKYGTKKMFASFAKLKKL